MNGLKLFWRNLLKQKTVAVLSIGSLAVAVAVVILIGLWATDELSYDDFHTDGKSVYRLGVNALMNDTPIKAAACYKQLGEDMLDHFPDIAAICRVYTDVKEITVEDKIYPGEKYFMTDSNFFTFFTFPLEIGDPRTCLQTPNGIIIDTYAAQRYFPAQDPVGKTLRLGKRNCTVVGVMKEMPRNSHLKAHIVTPFMGEAAGKIAYGNNDRFITYFKLPDPKVVPALEKAMTERIWDAIESFKDINYTCFLQPLEDVYFDNSFWYDDVEHGNLTLVLVFLLVAAVILLIACINFINLFISTSFLRAKSVGVKKTQGADKGMLMKEFYLETFYYVISAVGLGLLLALVGLPLFNRLAESGLEIRFDRPAIYLFLAGITFVVVLLAGTFPALYMTKFNTVETLKGKFKGKNLSILQKSLIIGQFTAAIVILITVIFIHKQVNYMMAKDLGFDKENVLYVNDHGGFIKNYEAFCQEMKSYPVIKEVSLKDVDPLTWENGGLVSKSGEEDSYMMEICRIVPNYFRLMGMKMLHGQEFPENGRDSSFYCILNETAARSLGLQENALGEKVVMRPQNIGCTVIGIVKDTYIKSLHKKVEPQIYLPFIPNRQKYGTVFFKIQGDPREAIRLVNEKWKELNPRNSFEYHFLDDSYAQLYHAETNTGNILGVAMGITLLISIAGLFAIAYYTTQRRLKEVGIRKVNGATITQLLLHLNRDFFGWVGIAFGIACPLSYVFVTHWLEGFVERTAVSWWVFAGVGLVTALITMLTVSYQTWKAAHINPVVILKTE